MLARQKVEKVIGKGFADRLDEQIFTVDYDFGYTRREMVEKLGCANFIAAARLAKVLRRLNINSPSKLHRLDPFSLARAKGIGEAALFVAMCILDANSFDVIKWWGFTGTTAKFSTYKHHAITQSRRRKQEVA